MPPASAAPRKRTAREGKDISPPPKRRKENENRPIKSKDTESVSAVSKKQTPKAKSKGTTEVTAVKVEKEVTVKGKTQSKSVKVEKVEKVEGGQEESIEIKEVKVKVKARRKTKEEKAAEAMPLAQRTATTGLRILAGAHVSAAGGVQNAVLNCNRIGGNAFAMFLKNQKQWAFKPLSNEDQSLYIANCKEHKFHKGDDWIPPVVPHGSYLVNMAHTEKSRADQAYNSFIDDLSRCNQLGIKLYNFHPGNCVGAESREEALKQLAKQLNRSHKDPLSGKVITLLETMAATGGNTIGSTFEELAEVISMIDDKSRVGVCFDTCHSFAAGYDMRTPEAFQETMTKFDSTIGLSYLRAFHVNDSKAPLGSGRDLHACLGTGFLGLRAFHSLVNDSRLWGLPFILETPGGSEIWAKEIKLLENMVEMDSEHDEFKQLERALYAAGKEDRDKVQDQVNRRKDKTKKKKKKGKAAQSDTEDEDSS